MDNWELRELISFENRGKVWFPDIHAQFKFDMITASREKTNKSFKARFYVTDWKEIDGEFDYPTELVKILSPEVLGISEFRSQLDIPIVSKIRGVHKLLGNTGLVIRTEFHETSDKDIFSDSKNGLILYEGKMIHQYNQGFSSNNYFVEEKKGRERLLGRATNRILEKLKNNGQNIDKEKIKNEINTGAIKMDYERERLAFRVVGSSTNERTIISCLIPSGVFLANSLPYFEPFNYRVSESSVLVQETIGGYIYYIQSLLNSFVLDYYIRQRVSANLNFFFLYELPIPEVNKDLESTIIELSKRLINNDDLKLRVKLEALIAKNVFGLNHTEMKLILDSFVYGNINKELVRQILEKMEND
jgi:hypothetical protein